MGLHTLTFPPAINKKKDNDLSYETTHIFIIFVRHERHHSRICSGCAR